MDKRLEKSRIFKNHLLFYTFLKKTRVFKNHSPRTHMEAESQTVGEHDTVFWGAPPEPMSRFEQAEADALRCGHMIVFKTLLARTNDAIREGRVVPSPLVGILWRDRYFFRFVEEVCVNHIEDSPEDSDGGGEGIAVLKLLLARVRGFPLGGGRNAVGTRQRAMAEYARIFGV